MAYPGDKSTGGYDSVDAPSSAAISRPATPATIHSAAQRGDVTLIAHLINTGRAAASDRDEEGITPLHWAAINAHVQTCQLLLDEGAEVDAVGGDLVATPLQWAARNGHLYVMHLLLSRGADPTITDAQGFNALHLTVHSSAVMPLLLMLQHPSFSAGASLDAPDSQGHTPLMWAAYQGDAISLDLLLAHGSDVHKQDAAGLTPMHWAVVKGNRLCITRMAESGSDLWAKEEGGKTPRDMAVELKSIGAYRKALADIGLMEDGRKKSRPLGDRSTRYLIMLVPFIALGLIFATLATLPWFTGLPLAAGELFAMHHIVTRVLLDPLEVEKARSSPYFLAIVSGSIAWVGWEWLTKLVRATPGNATTNLVFAISILACVWNLFRSATMEPGFAPRPQSDAERRRDVQKLADEGRLNGISYCVNCLARRPLRSKHCRLCKRCVARHDHHCPWINQCVGVSNHRQFMCFLFSLVVGVVSFDMLSYQYYAINARYPYVGSADSTCLLPGSLCSATDLDTFLFSVTLWASLQLTWTSVLLVAQTWQISRQMTTLEVSNLGRYGFMGGKGGSSMMTQSGFMEARAARLAAEGGGAAAPGPGGGNDEDEDGLLPTPATMGRGSGSGSGAPGTPGMAKHSHSPTAALKGAGNWLLSIVGLDLYTRGKAAEGLKRASKAGNPFDKGFVVNCRDFWSRGAELGVAYETLYDLPPEGLVPVSQQPGRRRDLSLSGGEDVEAGGGGGGHGGGRMASLFGAASEMARGESLTRWNMWRGAGAGGSGSEAGRDANTNGAGYERVSQHVLGEEDDGDGEAEAEGERRGHGHEP